MTWQEIHVQFQMLLQESGDFENTTFTNHKIDEWLNYGQLSVIDKYFPADKTTLGYSDNVVAAELLQSLQSFYTNPLYLFNDRAVRGFFPQDFYRTIGVRLNSNSYCSDRSTSTVGSTFNYWVIKLDATLTATTISEKLRKFYINCTVNNDMGAPVGDADMFRLVTLSITGLSDINLYPLVFNRYLLQYGGNASHFVEVYYERFADLYVKDSYILVQKPNSLTTSLVDMTVTYTDTAGLEAVDSIVKQSFVLSKQISTGTSRWVENVRFLDDEYEGVGSDDPYTKVKKSSPYCSMSGQQLLAFHYNKFNLFQYELKYLRLPKLIDHEINQGLDLGVSYGNKRFIAMEVVKEAVKLAAISTRAEILRTIQ